MTTSRYQKIIVPLDGSGWSQRAIPHALHLARTNDAELILTHVFTSPSREFTDQLALAHQEEQIQHLRQQAKRYLVGVRSELRRENIRVRTHYIEGSATEGVASLLCDYIMSEKADLVVMSTHGRTGVSRLLFGSIARSVMECIDIPVMLIQPEKE